MGVFNSFSGSSTDTGKNICCSHMPNWFACSVCLTVFVRKSSTKSKKSALCCSVGSASPCSNTIHPSSRGVNAQTNYPQSRQALVNHSVQVFNMVVFSLQWCEASSWIFPDRASVWTRWGPGHGRNPEQRSRSCGTSCQESEGWWWESFDWTHQGLLLPSA